MEPDENLEEVSGKIVNFNRGLGFFSFVKDGTEQICMFRPNKVLVDGQKIPASKIKIVEQLNKYIVVGDQISAVIRISTEVRAYSIPDSSGTDVTISPGWLANQVWKGEKPIESGRIQAETKEQEIIIDNVPGKIIFNQMSTGTARGGTSPTLIAFKNPEGEKDLAMFRHPRYFFWEGKRIEPKVYKKWSQDYQVEVHFTAVYTPGLKEFSAKIEEKENEQGMQEEVKFNPNWRAKLVWVGDKPSEAMIMEDSEKNKKSEREVFLDLIQGCEYMTTRVEKILNKNQGILTLRNINVIFHIEQLSIDGLQYTTQEDLLKILQPGETLFCYAKHANPPYKIENYSIDYEATQVWKGRRNLGSLTPADEDGKAKCHIPLPTEATHHDVVGKVVEIDSNVIYAVIKTEDPSLRGQKVLISRNRLYVNGSKLKFKDSLADIISPDDKILFDMVLANPEQSKSTYNWLAVLSWTGSTPDRTEINEELAKKTESYRAKVLVFYEQKGLGYTEGVAQIIGGPNRIGERVHFSREETYVFGATMRRADLAYVLKVGDKIQVDITELPAPITKFGAEVKFVASLIWVGPAPKMDENLEDFPYYVGGVISPFILKRGLTEESFKQLIKGQLPPKAGKLSPVPESKPVSLPPNITEGRVVELKKPEPGVVSGTEHGILRIDNGPFAQEKAFFNRNSLYCWGFNCSKADLMYLITENDRLRIEVQDGTNNKAVPFKVTSAWIGPHPHEKNKESVAMAGNLYFVKWLKEHNLTVEEFHRVVRGEINPKPFFPLPGQSHQARLASLLPGHMGPGGGADAGILRLCQNPANSKDGRKAPEVLFERDSFYLWNVLIDKGDLSYVMSENDKYFVEVTDLIGKEKKKWQTRLGTTNIPKFIATIVYVGGGRPKPDKINEISSNSNLLQWLKKRNMDVTLIDQLVKGQLLPKNENGEDIFSQAYPGGSGKDTSPFNNPATPRQLPFNLPPNPQIQGFQTSVLNKAMSLTQRTMSLQSADDPDVQNLILDDSDAQLALFLSKTLTNAIMMYRQGPGPIGPPRKPGSIGRGRGRGELSEFYPEGGLSRGLLSGRGEGLYGLTKPLLDYPMNGVEPPPKRKFESW